MSEAPALDGPRPRVFIDWMAEQFREWLKSESPLILPSNSNSAGITATVVCASSMPTAGPEVHRLPRETPRRSASGSLADSRDGLFLISLERPLSWRLLKKSTD
jgi:hypothetical protein